MSERNIRLLCLGAFLVCAGFLLKAYLKNVDFDLKCEGKLRRAANTSSIEIAKEELSSAIQYAEENGLTNGSTHVFIASSNNDIGFWYKNLKAAQVELEKISAESSQLETTNVLIKLRETITDDDKNSVTLPQNIVYYPNVLFWILFAILAVVNGLLATIVLCASLSN